MGSLTSLKTQMPATISIFQLVLTIQFLLSFFIFVLATLGIAFGYEVASYYLLALLQIVLAAPGIVYLATQSTVFLSLYVAFQLVMIVCEVYWLVFMIFDGASTGKWISLALVTATQIYAVVIAIFSRNSTISIRGFGKKKKDDDLPQVESSEHTERSDRAIEKSTESEGRKSSKKPRMKNASADSLSESESKAGSSKLKKRRDRKLPKKSKSHSNSERSSKRSVRGVELTFPKDSMSSLDS